MIKSRGMDALLSASIKGQSAGGIAFLLTGFAFASLLKTAQGSTTSAMIITSALLSPLMAAAGFDSIIKISVLIMAVAGGAMTVSHANDSYFWVVSQFSGMSAKDAFRNFTVISLLQGITALITSIIFYLTL